MSYIGIDIGTTSICGVLIDNKKQIKSITEINESALKSENQFERLQDPENIRKTVWKILDELIDCQVRGIGITGQMHGIVYVDQNGNAISPLYTWQDQSGEEKIDERESYCERLSGITGYKMASGYGLTTLYTHKEKGNIPKSANKILTIQDYIVRCLTSEEVHIHPSNAAGLGLFDIEKRQWDFDALRKAGIGSELLPAITEEQKPEGYYRGIPVSHAIGDNQASFLGSMGEDGKGVLVNIGTGSQISVQIEKPYRGNTVETRPYIKGKYLLVGAPLCGGRAYAALKSFFEMLIKESGQSGELTYKMMDKMAEETKKESGIIADTELEGSRSCPERRGKIENISLENFTPGDFCLAFLRGTVRELKAMYRDMEKAEKEDPEYIIMSGNGLRNSSLWREIVLETFLMPAKLAPMTEEAACGAAIYAQIAAERE